MHFWINIHILLKKLLNTRINIYNPSKPGQKQVQKLNTEVQRRKLREK